MKKELGTIKNPLTVISIFAGVAEIAGAAVLPLISPDNQITYIWFLMFFPIYLVSLFFLTLNFNSRVLYAPSDFKDEKNYMDLFRPSTMAEQREKLEDEVALTTSMDATTRDVKTDSEIMANVEGNKQKSTSATANDATSRYMQAEELIVDRISAELGVSPMRNLALNSGSTSVLIDAAFETSSELFLLEIKFMSERTSLEKMHQMLNRIMAALEAIPKKHRDPASFILAVAHEMPNTKAEVIKRQLQSMMRQFPINASVRMFNFKELVESA